MASSSDQSDPAISVIRAEAEVLVREQKEQALADRRAKRSEILAVPALDHQEVSERGRSVAIYRRVAPPQLLPQPVLTGSKSSKAVELDDAETSRLDSSLRHESRFVAPVITVYGGHYSVLEWPYKGRRYQVFVREDLNCLSEVGHMELRDVKMQFFPIVVDVQGVSPDARLSSVLARNPLKAVDPVFQFEADRVPSQVKEEIQALERYFVENRERLEAQWRKREAYNEAKRQWEETNPPQHEPTVINYFKIR